MPSLPVVKEEDEDGDDEETQGSVRFSTIIGTEGGLTSRRDLSNGREQVTQVYTRERWRENDSFPAYTDRREREREKERANHTLSPVLSFSSLARVSVGLCCFCCRICSNFIEKHAQVGEASKHGVYTVHTHTHILSLLSPDSTTGIIVKTKRENKDNMTKHDETRGLKRKRRRRGW